VTTRISRRNVMKNLFILLSTMLVFGLWAGGSLQADEVVGCGEDPTDLTVGNCLYEVDVRCDAPADDGIDFSGVVEVLPVDVGTSSVLLVPGFSTNFKYGSRFVCFAGGVLDMPKTAVKCTDAASGSGKPDKGDYVPGDVTVEFGIIEIDKPDWDCGLNGD
jgi:hypothetical protein